MAAPLSSAGTRTRTVRNSSYVISKFAERIVQVTWPYLLAFVLAAGTEILTHRYWVGALIAGAAGWHALLRLHESYGWHRRGGKAAARKRRKYQGAASYRERRAKLSFHAIRKQAHVTRPATERPCKLPAEELGVLIGQTVRRSR